MKNYRLNNPQGKKSIGAIGTAVNAAEKLDHLIGSGTIVVNHSAAGVIIEDRRKYGFWAEITGGSQPYAFTEQVDDGAGVLADDLRTGTTTVNPAYDILGNTSVAAGNIVWMEPAKGGNGYLFDSTGKSGTGGSCCCTWWVWLRMEETTGNFIDSSGNNENFTEVNGTVATAVGKVTNARTFTKASSQHGTRAYGTDWAVGVGPFMISCWFYADALGDGDCVIMAKPAGAGTAWKFWVDNSGAARFTFGGKTATNTDGISDDTWYHIIAWYDDLTDAIYVTVNAGTAATTGTITHTDASATIYLGQEGDGTDYMGGRLDEVIVAKVAPTAAQRAALYNSGNGIDDANCWLADINPPVLRSNTNYPSLVVPQSPGNTGTSFVISGSSATGASGVQVPLIGSSTPTGTAVLPINIKAQAGGQIQFNGVAAAAEGGNDAALQSIKGGRE